MVFFVSIFISWKLSILQKTLDSEKRRLCIKSYSLILQDMKKPHVWIVIFIFRLEKISTFNKKIVFNIDIQFYGCRYRTNLAQSLFSTKSGIMQTWMKADHMNRVVLVSRPNKLINNHEANDALRRGVTVAGSLCLLTI